MLETKNKVVQWAKDRNLIEGATPDKQFLKLAEEMGELGSSLAKNNQDEIKDAIGDMMVVLTIMAEQLGMTVDECYAHAYNEIKDRKGKMVDGVFVKESDLPNDTIKDKNPNRNLVDEVLHDFLLNLISDKKQYDPFKKYNYGKCNECQKPLFLCDCYTFYWS